MYSKKKSQEWSLNNLVMHFSGLIRKKVKEFMRRIYGQESEDEDGGTTAIHALAFH